MNILYGACAVLLLTTSCKERPSSDKMYDKVNVVFIDSSKQSITSNQLLYEYRINRTESEKKYNGDTLYILGIIDYIDDDIVLLKDSVEMHSVLCYLKDSTTKTFLRKWDKVLFRGVSHGFSGSNIEIRNCELAQILNK